MIYCILGNCPWKAARGLFLKRSAATAAAAVAVVRLPWPSLLSHGGFFPSLVQVHWLHILLLGRNQICFSSKVLIEIKAGRKRTWGGGGSKASWSYKSLLGKLAALFATSRHWQRESGPSNVITRFADSAQLCTKTTLFLSLFLLRRCCSSLLCSITKGHRLIIMPLDPWKEYRICQDGDHPFLQAELSAAQSYEKIKAHWFGIPAPLLLSHRDLSLLQEREAH